MPTILNARPANEAAEPASLPHLNTQRGADISISSEPAPSLTVAQIVTLYLRHAEADGVHCPEAHHDRARTLALFVAACGSLPVDECKTFHLTDFIAAHPTWRSNATKKGKASTVRACFAWACDEERIPRNPFRRVKYAAPERRPEFPDNTLEVVAKLANKRFEAAVRFLRLTGCRVGELCRATWSEMDLQLGVWTIQKHKSRKHTGRPKLVALVPEAAELLLNLKGSVVKPGASAARMPAPSPALCVLPAAVPAPTDFVFTNTRGTCWTRRTLGQQLARLKKRHGINENATLHGIRHCAASTAIRNGAKLKFVSQMLGHSTTAVTEKFYVHTNDNIEAIREAAVLSLPRTAPAPPRPTPAQEPPGRLPLSS